jgi:two-component system nitrate/nitrite sensor histidine kinase NarX
LFRWVILGIFVFVLVLIIFVGVQLMSLADLPLSNGLAYAVLILALAGAAGFIASRFVIYRADRARFQKRAAAAEELSAIANQRLSAVLRLSQKFVEASEERDVVELVLRLSVELVGAVAASFVPLDERGQPLTAINYGDLPVSVLNAWVEYLASPAVRHRCGACENHGALTQTCPLLQAPFTEVLASPGLIEIYCLPLRRGEREFGILNLYLPEGYNLDTEAKVFLRAVLDETSLALEGIRFRRRELAALGQLRAVSQRTDLAGLLSNFLENVRETLKADFAYLVVLEKETSQPPTTLATGAIPDLARPMIDGLIQGILISAKPVLLGDVAGLPAGDPAPVPNLKALLVAPLAYQEGAALGAIAVGSSRALGFTQRQLALLQTLAAQVALVVQNSQLMSELEYKTMMAERTRLAREIHDGLAQTLGFLKLQTAQMQSYLAQGERERLADSLRTSYRILAEAYLDARQAIDGLRIVPSEDGLSGWLEQTVVEFKENTGLEVELVDLHDVDHLVPEVQAQLIRIVQEALSNVRKHARASQVWVSCQIVAEELILEVRDNGCGFSPEDIPGSSRYGLQGMRERTELISAEFQVISRPAAGTTVRVCLPLSIGETPV